MAIPISKTPTMSIKEAKYFQKKTISNKQKKLSKKEYGKLCKCLFFFQNKDK